MLRKHLYLPALGFTTRALSRYLAHEGSRVHTFAAVHRQRPRSSRPRGRVRKSPRPSQLRTCPAALDEQGEAFVAEAGRALPGSRAAWDQSVVCWLCVWDLSLPLSRAEGWPVRPEGLLSLIFSDSGLSLNTALEPPKTGLLFSVLEEGSGQFSGRLS